ncbi:type II toxin-antitoxin system RelE/ParE family toxin [Paraglaciecola sp. MB-3u-78]|jgi:plasmid stabilization system protein ParE|uniref:type II toxin-antitoxin system RelE/ParE family toxin n=1 Tax=Paraglaciecola sp. MB-3u-78 TaxID=2058332 RepID=UPI000C32FE14|nr:type II toxin-antitoxin system RelE/ParE family toxin [Paraglaciecola sp. MB-3u-78]PKG97977.1 plasmid stabilization protein [Paraglaciecola sp. MB-3u-78]
MSQIVVTQNAAQGLEICRLFLAEKNPLAATHAGQIIIKHFQLLEQNPQLGKSLNDDSELYELIIGFGDSGYVALYRYDPVSDVVYLLAFKHQKQAGY